MKSQIVMTANGPKKFYKFENEEDFNQWEQGVFGEWANQYNKKVEAYLKEQQENYFDKAKMNQDLYFAAACIEMYCGNEHKNINGFLRGEPYFCNETVGRIDILRYISELEKCFWTAPVTDENLICYRSMTQEEIEFYEHNTFVNKYSSVSGTLESLSNNFDVKTAYTMLIPKGTRILCPNMIKPVIEPEKTCERHESELILPRCVTIKKEHGNYVLSDTQY